jgi:hypothetical protein
MEKYGYMGAGAGTAVAFYLQEQWQQSVCRNSNACRTAAAACLKEQQQQPACRNSNGNLLSIMVATK